MEKIKKYIKPIIMSAYTIIKGNKRSYKYKTNTFSVRKKFPI